MALFKCFDLTKDLVGKLEDQVLKLEEENNRLKKNLSKVEDLLGEEIKKQISVIKSYSYVGNTTTFYITLTQSMIEDLRHDKGAITALVLKELEAQMLGKKHEDK